MQNLTISNFFGAPEFCFDAKFGVAIFCRNCVPPCTGKSPSLQKIATPNFASKQISGSPKKFNYSLLQNYVKTNAVYHL